MTRCRESSPSAGRSGPAAATRRPCWPRWRRPCACATGFQGICIDLHRPAWDDFEVVLLEGDEAVRERLMGTTTTWDAVRRAARGAVRPRRRLLRARRAASTGRATTPSRRRRSRRPTIRAPGTPRICCWCRCVASDGEVLGVVSVDEPDDGRRPDAARLALVAAVCDHAAAALEHAQATADARRHSAAVDHLLQVSAQLGAGESAADVLATVCSGIRDALGFTKVVVVLPDDDDVLQPMAAVGWTDDELAGLPRATRGRDRAAARPRRAARGLRAVRARGREVARCRPRCTTPPGPHARPRAARVGQARPARAAARRGGRDRRRHLGGRPRRPAHPDAAAAPGAARVRQPGVGRDRVGAPAREHDPSRRARSADRPAQPARLQGAASTAGSAPAGRVSLLVCDLDNFKRVNDSLGHEAGDAVLEAFAGLLRDCTRDLRRADAPGRRGVRARADRRGGRGGDGRRRAPAPLGPRALRGVPGARLGLDRGRHDRPGDHDGRRR